VEAAASQAGCSDRSIRGWLRDDARFKIAYREARRQIMDQSIVTLQRAYGLAVTELVRELASGNENIRHRAAVVILDRADRWVTTESLESRIAVLEACLELRNPARGNGKGNGYPFRG